MAFVLSASVVGIGSATTQAAAPGTTNPDAGAVYGVAVPQGQQLSVALGQLTIVRPELKAQILRTLESGAVPGGATVAANVRAGRIAATTTFTELPSAQTVVALNGTSSFEGAFTLTGFDCTRSGCVAASTITHNAIFDLGYTTYAVTSRTNTLDRRFWTGISASGFCSFGPRASCSSTNSYPVGSKWVRRIFSFNTSMGERTARILSSFSASWKGSPASLSGFTPYFSCSSADKFCRFT